SCSSDLERTGTMKKIAILLFTALLLTAAAAPAALAQISVETAKQQGLVGERPDGMLGIVANPTVELKDLVDKINAERAAKYKGIAEKRGTTLNAVQAYAGRKLIEKAGPGEYIMNAGGG